MLRDLSLYSPFLGSEPALRSFRPGTPSIHLQSLVENAHWSNLMTKASYGNAGLLRKGRFLGSIAFSQLRFGYLSSCTKCNTAAEVLKLSHDTSSIIVSIDSCS
jgi:hypothetical protein